MVGFIEACQGEEAQPPCPKTGSSLVRPRPATLVASPHARQYDGPLRVSFQNTGPDEIAVAWTARICCVNEARLEDTGSGLAPVTEGWFVVNVRDAEWFSSETRGAACWFANEYGESAIEFAQFGINVTVLEPGQSSVYHAEANQEAFLVLAGECRLLVEGEERVLRAWDFFIHLPGRSMRSWEPAMPHVWS